MDTSSDIEQRYQTIRRFDPKTWASVLQHLEGATTFFTSDNPHVYTKPETFVLFEIIDMLNRRIDVLPPQIAVILACFRQEVIEIYKRQRTVASQ